MRWPLRHWRWRVMWKREVPQGMIVKAEAQRRQAMVQRRTAQVVESLRSALRLTVVKKWFSHRGSLRSKADHIACGTPGSLGVFVVSILVCTLPNPAHGAAGVNNVNPCLEVAGSPRLDATARVSQLA